MTENFSSSLADVVIVNAVATENLTAARLEGGFRIRYYLNTSDEIVGTAAMSSVRNVGDESSARKLVQEIRALQQKVFVWEI
ncbi:hypothetical protein ACLOJK_030756 [Asimina triloba]